MQLNLQVAKSEGADARRRAEEATSSYNSIKAEYSTTQSQTEQAAKTAAAEISSLQASILCIFFALRLASVQLDAAKCRPYMDVPIFYHLGLA